MEIRRLPKKACPTDSPQEWCKLGLIYSEIPSSGLVSREATHHVSNLYKSSRFAHPSNPLQDSSNLSSSTPLRTPSLGCASEGAGYRFPVLPVQGHRAHAAPIANAKAAAGAVQGRGAVATAAGLVTGQAAPHRQLQKLVGSAAAGGADGFGPQADPQASWGLILQQYFMVEICSANQNFVYNIFISQTNPKAAQIRVE